MSFFIKNPFLRVLVFVFFLRFTSLIAQVGIGTDTPAASAALEIQSTQKGLLISRMTQLQLNAIADPGVFWCYQVLWFLELYSQ